MTDGTRPLAMCSSSSVEWRDRDDDDEEEGGRPGGESCGEEEDDGSCIMLPPPMARALAASWLRDRCRRRLALFQWFLIALSVRP